MEQYPQAGRPEKLMTRYAVVFEKAERNWAAYVPDLPGCVATAATLEGCKYEIGEAIRFHLEGMREEGIDIPLPSSVTDYVAA